MYIYCKLIVVAKLFDYEDYNKFIEMSDLKLVLSESDNSDSEHVANEDQLKTQKRRLKKI